nr:TetR family transcriptional regulator [Streptomyces monomycini]
MSSVLEQCPGAREGPAIPKEVDHRGRREAIARALWRVVEQRGVIQLTMRVVAQEAGMSLGQLQHYFASRTAMLSFAMIFASEQTSVRVHQGLEKLTSQTRSGGDSHQHVETTPRLRCIAIRSPLGPHHH